MEKETVRNLLDEPHNITFKKNSFIAEGYDEIYFDQIESTMIFNKNGKTYHRVILGYWVSDPYFSRGLYDAVLNIRTDELEILLGKLYVARWEV